MTPLERLPFADADADVIDDRPVECELTDVTIADDDPERCCKGGWLQLWCKLCKQSPTYWRKTEGTS